MPIRKIDRYLIKSMKFPKLVSKKKKMNRSIILLLIHILLPCLFRDNLVFLEVGFKSLSYELQEQQPAYDSNSLFGKKRIILA